MLQNANSEYVYWKLKLGSSISEYGFLNGYLIVNDFDKPYIAIEFASWHFVMDTISNSLLSHLVLSLIHVLKFFTWNPFKR